MNDQKHLNIDSKPTFVNHIIEKLSKARNGVGVIKYLSSSLPVKTLDQIYKMYVRPHLDFLKGTKEVPTPTRTPRPDTHLDFLKGTRLLRCYIPQMTNL